jgi:cyclophilin family peptidyl-prolyl cis-trans isomerase
MNKTAALLALTLTAAAPAPPAAPPAPAPSPGEIVAAAKAEEWVPIEPSDLLVMELVGIPDGKVLKPRRIVIQLMPPPFSQGWVDNIRKLAAAKWWDGTSVNRVQDNYVVQWGDATEKKALPPGLVTVLESSYSSSHRSIPVRMVVRPKSVLANIALRDAYAIGVSHWGGWPMASDKSSVWPVHCYGMVGVGRNMSPDTGSGAELYTVIGHAPRHLDRNIALVGRVIEGIEHLSSLPRGTGALGFYEKPEERVTITSVRIGTDVAGLPPYQYLSTESAAFAKYADARANRRDPFFIKPAGGADICNIPVPVRRKP